ncbi:MAG TPA: HAMP domain-containing sensor histidine kinase [Lacisediminihabitans sp.]|uniref:sensor histidine kinase n=1 Tax=Lacisediminihabitans sp. TaxID=2787631 RepID=UPI002EDACA4C
MMRLRRLSIRWRITLGTLGIAAVLSAAAVVVFRAQVDHILSSTTSTLLSHDAAPYVAEILASPSDPIEEPGRGQLVAVVDPQRSVVETSLPRSLRWRTGELLALGDGVHSVVGGDDVYRVLKETVMTDAGEWDILTARNQDSSILSLRRITQALVWSAVVLVAGFGTASWLLTGAALRPVTRMRRQAEALVAERSTEPLPLGEATDELSDLARTLNEFIDQLRQSVDRERQLVSDASHELRTPLAILMTQLELAHLSSGDAAALEAEIDAAQSSVARLSAIATGLLELSQIEARPPESGSTGSELSAELVAAVDRARMLAVARDITVDFDIIGEPGDASYLIAAGNFGRLVDNLTTNAIAALGEAGTVRIVLRHSAEDLLLTVVDSGPGMPEDFLPVAFDRFSRPDEARANHAAGSGLGLAIVHAMVTAAGGRVDLANAAGLDAAGITAAGLTVEVRLPAQPV